MGNIKPVEEIITYLIKWTRNVEKTKKSKLPILYKGKYLPPFYLWPYGLYCEWANFKLGKLFIYIVFE